jgi:hypothetical protein
MLSQSQLLSPGYISQLTSALLQKIFSFVLLNLCLAVMSIDGQAGYLGASLLPSRLHRSSNTTPSKTYRATPIIPTFSQIRVDHAF